MGSKWRQSQNGTLKKHTLSVSLKGDDVLCANRIRKRKDCYSETRNNIYCSGLKESLKGGSTMKGNIKKLAVLVIVPVMALFTMGLISSAGSATRRPFNGQYVGNGSSFCWMALGGFDPVSGEARGDWAGGPSIWEAEFTFSNDGTGTASGDVRSVDLSSPLAGTPVIWSGTFSYEFTYAFTDAAHITFTSVPNTFTLEKPSGTFHFDIVPNHGVITADSKTILISSGPPLVLSFMNQDPATGQWHPAGPKQACSVSIVLIKIK